MTNHRLSIPGAAPLLVLALGLAPALGAQPSSFAGIGVASVRQAPRHGFSLGIEAALPSVEPASATTTAAPARELATSRSVLRLGVPELRAVAAMRRQEEPPPPSDQPANRDGGFGRWLKRHWWVPVLVGAAAGVAISDSGGDDDRGGEDD